MSKLEILNEETQVVTKTEKDILINSRLFAKLYNIHFDEKTEIIVLNAIREMKNKTKQNLQ